MFAYTEVYGTEAYLLLPLLDSNFATDVVVVLALPSFSVRVMFKASSFENQSFQIHWREAKTKQLAHLFPVAIYFKDPSVVH
mmetsp:Transcript_17842/g.43362  ORF Transcript_17842/g.43362 Transcript_17842/m.43362 type:complete len:82 (+) Transcript_17842:1253-1498(+)